MAVPPGTESNEQAMSTSTLHAGSSVAKSDDPRYVERPFSIFTRREKKWISSVVSFGAMFSTLSSYIYFPALVPMANDLGVSISLINLTIMSYMIVAGIAPAFLGDFADQGGRRPAYIAMFSLMVGSNIGLALQQSYTALFLLRMVQSAGSSGTYGAAYGVLADITSVEERGSYVGSLIFFAAAAPSFGPVIAGVLANKLSWRWIFWFLVILTAAHLIVLLLFLPETQRKIVGNGSLPVKGVYRSVFDVFLRDRKQKYNKDDDNKKTRKFHIPNPFACVPMLFRKGNFSVIMIGSITYMVKMTLQASLAAQCIDIYSLDYLQAGLIYLPSAVGGALASYSTGKFLDRSIKRISTQLGIPYRRGNDISGFPIEEARLVGILMLLIISAAGTTAYGISLMERTHIAVPLVIQFITGASTSAIFTICATLLTDLNPGASATVQGSYNIVRCLLAGAGIAFQQPLADATGSGWCFGVFAIIIVLAVPLAVVLRRCGPGWRKKSAAVSTEAS